VPAPTNLDFETPGAAAGSIDAWTISSGNSAADPTWLAAGWNQYENTGAPAADPNVPFLGPNNFKGVNGFWTEHNTNVDTDFFLSPDGTVDADRLRDNLVLIAHYIDETAGPRPFKAGIRYTFGFLWKWSTVGVGIGPRIDFGGGHVVGAQSDVGPSMPIVQLRTSAPIGPVASISAEVSDAGAGWINIALSFVLSVDTAARPGFGFQAGGTEVYAGTLQGSYIWGAYIYAGELTPAEDFEFAWASGTYAFALVLGVNALGALFGNGTTVKTSTDGFEGGWNNSPYYLTMDFTITSSAVWDAGETNLGAETFNAGDGTPGTGWDDGGGNGIGYQFDLSLDSPVGAVWDAGDLDLDAEDFETFGNSTWDPDYREDLIGITTAATWDLNGSESAEDFEEVVNDILYTADSTTDTMTATGHGLALNTVVRLVNVGGAFPGPLVRTLDYFVVNPTANTFQLSLTASGAAINITDNGTGDQYVRGSDKRYWVQPDGINPTI
jgi:hypothetical protein